MNLLDFEGEEKGYKRFYASRDNLKANIGKAICYVDYVEPYRGTQEYEGEITYRFLQVKKDGTPSSRRLYVDYWYYDREEKKVNIELVNTDYRNKNFDGTPKTTEQ